KELAVLAYLAMNLGRPVGADELVDAVWGEDAPRSAHNSLLVRLSHLRKDLAGEDVTIVRDGGGYRLDIDAGHVDSRRFERLVGGGGGRPPAEALEAYDRALAEVRGRPYADIAEYDFVQGELRRLDALRLSAVEGRLRALVELGRHAEALPELERLIPDE